MIMVSMKMGCVAKHDIAVLSPRLKRWASRPGPQIDDRVQANNMNLMMLRTASINITRQTAQK